MYQNYYPAGKFLRELYLNKNNEDRIREILAGLRLQAKERPVAFPRRTAHASELLVRLLKQEGQNFLVLDDAEYTEKSSVAFARRKAAREKHKKNVPSVEHAPGFAVDAGPAHAEKAIPHHHRKNNKHRQRKHRKDEEGWSHHGKPREEERGWEKNLPI